MRYRALQSLLLGNRPSVDPGELIPDTYSDMNGTPVPVDFDRLVDAGIAEKVDEPAKAAPKQPAKADELAPRRRKAAKT